MPLAAFDNPPVAEYIRELHEHINTYWAPQRLLDKELIDLYYNEHRVPVPDTDNEKRKRRIKPEVVKMGEAARVTDLTTSFYVQHSMIGVAWVGQEKKGPKQQDLVESGINETIDQLVPAPELQATRWYTNLLGRSAELGPLPSGLHYADFPFKREDETETEWARRYQDWNRGSSLPFVWQVLPAESTFPPSFGATNDEVLSTMVTTWRELEMLFSPEELAGLRDERTKVWDEVTLGIYGNLNYLAYCLIRGGEERSWGPIPMGRRDLNDAILRVVEHKLGRCPIRINSGMTTALKTPGKHWKSVLFHIRDLCLQLDRRASEAATASKFGAMPLMKMRLQDLAVDSEGAASDMREYFEGDVIELKARTGDQGEEDIEPLFQPASGVATLQQIELLAARSAQISGATEGLEGSLGPAGQAAWARSFIVDLARSHFSQLTDSITDADIDRVEMLQRAVSAHGERIPLNPRGSQKSNIYLDPDDIREWAAYLKAEFKLRVAQNQRADFGLGVESLERCIQGRLPVAPPTIMTNLMGIEQPEQELELALTWMYLLSEEAMKAQINKMLDEADIEIAQDEGMTPEAFMAMAQGQLPPEIIAAVMSGAGQQNGQPQLPPSGGPNTWGETLGAEKAGGGIMGVAPPGPKPERMGY